MPRHAVVPKLYGGVWLNASTSGPGFSGNQLSLTVDPTGVDTTTNPCLVFACSMEFANPMTGIGCTATYGGLTATVIPVSLHPTADGFEPESIGMFVVLCPFDNASRQLVGDALVLTFSGYGGFIANPNFFSGGFCNYVDPNRIASSLVKQENYGPAGLPVFLPTLSENANPNDLVVSFCGVGVGDSSFVSPTTTDLEYTQLYNSGVIPLAAGYHAVTSAETARPIRWNWYKALTFPGMGGCAFLMRSIGGSPAVEPGIERRNIDFYDHGQGTLELHWWPFDGVCDSYNLYQDGVFIQNIPAAIANLPGLITTVSGLQYPTYNAATGVLVPPRRYTFLVVAVNGGVEEVPGIQGYCTPQPQSIQLVTPMKRLYPFPNTGLN